MKYLLVVLVCLAVVVGRAEESHGLQLSAQKTVLEKDQDRDAFYEWDKVSKALGLKVTAKNVSFKEMPEGTIDYEIVVKRWGHTPTLYESYRGSEKFPALKAGEETRLTVAKVKMSGYEAGGNRKQFMDSVEGWRLVVKHAGVETLKLASTSSFDQLLAKAKPGR